MYDLICEFLPFQCQLNLNSQNDNSKQDFVFDFESTAESYDNQSFTLNNFNSIENDDQQFHYNCNKQSIQHINYINSDKLSFQNNTMKFNQKNDFLYLNFGNNISDNEYQQISLPTVINNISQIQSPTMKKTGTFKTLDNFCQCTPYQNNHLEKQKFQNNKQQNDYSFSFDEENIEEESQESTQNYNNGLQIKNKQLRIQNFLQQFENNSIKLKNDEQSIQSLSNKFFESQKMPLYLDNKISQVDEILDTETDNFIISDNENGINQLSVYGKNSFAKFIEQKYQSQDVNYVLNREERQKLYSSGIQIPERAQKDMSNNLIKDQQIQVKSDYCKLRNKNQEVDDQDIQILNQNLFATSQNLNPNSEMFSQFNEQKNENQIISCDNQQNQLINGKYNNLMNIIKEQQNIKRLGQHHIVNPQIRINDINKRQMKPRMITLNQFKNNNLNRITQQTDQKFDKKQNVSNYIQKLRQSQQMQQFE
ncbi:hypothetical protein PPERSA_09767 [Pseudocohnilembus persalinus]|uniref:Uncharacterized protein n=1 Tax=Pseudocohnilembus persalinus TaxID=266149 RepID=A0A0V0QTV3_PSEPJ|nr:hypothetical protein PPERSA_09767 [Pseudocohnilembus persalinus]|eukprot:KRX05627.1 hypothetical protein PPERSA_09767 [Pseudocohnilembus persalinus]